MKALINTASFFLLVSFVACDKPKDIRRLLNSKIPNDNVEGVWEAGETHDKQYVPLLLKNAGDPSASTSLHFKGFTVYQETMFALQKIFKVAPPHPFKNISDEPDSVNIKFYEELWRKENNKH